MFTEPKDKADKSYIIDVVVSDSPRGAYLQGVELDHTGFVQVATEEQVDVPPGDVRHLELVSRAGFQSYKTFLAQCFPYHER